MSNSLVMDKPDPSNRNSSKSPQFLSSSYVDKLLDSVLNEQVRIEAHDCSERDYSIRSVVVSRPETPMFKDMFARRSIPNDSVIVSKYWKDFEADGIQVSKDDSKRISACIESRAMEIGLEKASQIVEFLSARSHFRLDTALLTPENNESVLSILRDGSQLSINNRFGALRLPVDRNAMLPLDSELAVRLGLGGLLGVGNKVKRGAVVVSDGTFFLTAYKPNMFNTKGCSFSVAMPRPRCNLPRIEGIGIEKLLNAIGLGERLKPLKVIAGQDAYPIWALLSEACSEARYKAFKSVQS